MSLGATFLASALETLKNSGHGVGAVGAAVRSVFRYPIKAIAVFITAPILAVRIALLANNPWRRTIAVVGLLLAIILAWVAGTFIGSSVGALFMGSQFGLIIGLGFFIGTTLSVTLSVAFCLLVFNATYWLFLQISTEDVIAHLNNVSNK